VNSSNPTFENFGWCCLAAACLQFQKKQEKQAQLPQFALWNLQYASSMFHDSKMGIRGEKLIEIQPF
jgi:hypothetical protein